MMESAQFDLAMIMKKERRRGGEQRAEMNKRGIYL
jgi:hypothetical protein